MNILSVEPFQETLGQGLCAPATLKMLLMYWKLPGAELSDIALAHECGTDASLGTSNEQFVQTAERFGLTCTRKDWATFEDVSSWLEKGIPVVVDWFSPGRKDAPEGEMPDGHYSIVVGLDEKNIYLQDPEVGGLRTIERVQFMRVWFDYKGHTIEQPLQDSLEVRVMIAVRPLGFENSFRQ